MKWASSVGVVGRGVVSESPTPSQCQVLCAMLAQIVDPDRDEEARAHALVSVTVDAHSRVLGAYTALFCLISLSEQKPEMHVCCCLPHLVCMPAARWQH